MTDQTGSTTTADEILSGRDLRGRCYLVTGAASGIGRETARTLVAHGATVVGTVRDASQANHATSIIREAASKGGGLFKPIVLNLGSLASVRAASEELLKDGRRFDAVIANAGVMATPQGRTVDGFETQFGVNHLGHFAFVNRIEPLIADGGRLVVLSSQAHRVSDVDLDDPHFERQAYDPFLAYGRSKTANALFAVEFDRRHRGRGVRAASVMPGNSLTGLPRNFTPEALQDLLRTVGEEREKAGLPPARLKEIGQAAATSVWAAVVADPYEIGGRYLEDVGVSAIENAPNPFADGVRSYALDAERARQLWRKSAALTGTGADVPAAARVRSQP